MLGFDCVDGLIFTGFKVFYDPRMLKLLRHLIWLGILIWQHRLTLKQISKLGRGLNSYNLEKLNEDQVGDGGHAHYKEPLHKEATLYKRSSSIEVTLQNPQNHPKASPTSSKR